ncbi:HNH endonuclease [Candidatus Mycolicibacterium alkanivorans]|uniref:HNH endonuclease n=1 Tax=Candidatus Mycolicibacterium alkanivorans TaxID=2954114 RepID=UPI00207BF716
MSRLRFYRHAPTGGSVVADGVVDPLLLGQRVVAILETGLRTATYKLATLMALIDHCVENLPEQLDDDLAVPIPDLARRVLEVYWRQVVPFDGHELRQSTQPRARILIAANNLRNAAGTQSQSLAIEIAAIRAPDTYQRAIDEITLCLAQQPLHRLQRLPGSDASDCFLYDDSFLHDHVSRSTLRAHNDSIVLNPGVAHGLARLAGLLKPALEIMWVDDVRRMNKFLLADRFPDVAGHLFGRERVMLNAVREPLKEAFGPHCFYCNTHLPAGNPIDHVLPWSLVGIDGLANLVLACARCNSDKSGALPAIAIVDRVLERDQETLEDIAATIQWPTQHQRVVAAARGIYRGQPAGLPTWSGYGDTVRLDVSFPPAWLST